MAPDGVNPGLPFQVYRKPARTPAAPLELPAPVVVDLEVSGVGAHDVGSRFFIYPDPSAGQNPAYPSSITIMFGPNGRLERVYGIRQVEEFPLGPIHLMVGRSDQLGIPNLQDPQNMWVTIGHNTGLVTVAPNNGGPNVGLGTVHVSPPNFARPPPRPVQ